MPPEEKGLTSKEASVRLKKFGPNVLPERPPPSNFLIFVSQLKNPLVYVLVIAGIVTLLLNQISDTAIIFFAVFINTILGFFQERRAGRALYALKKLIHPTAKVVRDGKARKIDVTKIVPGDVMILSHGDKVPADGKLIRANRFLVEEAILTGESVPVGKEKEEEVYMGTIVSAGQGTMVVKTTGGNTEMGKIALSIQKPPEDTPLKKQLTAFSKQLSILVLILIIFVFVVGLASGKDIAEIFTTSVALAVSAIPEGLLVALTVVLAIGMQRILKHRGLVRTLVSAETLGGVTIICADKTGTLTLGKLQVVEIIGDEGEVAKQAYLTDNDPIMAVALGWFKEKNKNQKPDSQGLLKRYPRIDSIPFSPQNRFFASLNRGDDSNLVLVNGAPEVLLKWSNASEAQKVELQSKINELTNEGKRLIGLAKKEVSPSVKKLSVKDLDKDLSWVGLLVFSDPVRRGVKQALAQTRKAGINTLVITGDYAQTAISVMKELGVEIKENNTILGKELDKLSVRQVSQILAGNKIKKENRVKLFARTKPQQKLKIVEALKANGEIVAMMGDGVNDAPALAKADIGIVVGEATDVAKESADLVLLDSSFETIVDAIREGRGIFDNIRKIILYLMSDAFEEIFAISATLLMGLPLPVTAAQILWINLISDGFPHLALTVDPKHRGIMQRKPRSPKENIVAPWMRKLILIVSLAGGGMALFLFVLFYRLSGDLVLSRSIAFATLGVNSLVYVFAIRTLTAPFWQENPLANKWLNLAVLGGFFLQIGPFVFEPAREFLSLAPLGTIHWLSIFSAAILMFIIIEVSKTVLSQRLK